LKKVTTTRLELLDNGVDDQRFRALIYDLLAFSSRLEEVRNGLGVLLGVTGPQYSTLIAIRMLSGERPVGITDVADFLHVSGAFVTSEVNKLVKLGLVEKVRDREDRRRVSLSVTAEAEAQLDELSTYQRPVNDRLFANITREEFLVLSKVLKQLVSQGDEAELYMEYLLKKHRPRLADDEAG
jgi:DNA-binding MarR family transcriptional regulator